MDLKTLSAVAYKMNLLIIDRSLFYNTVTISLHKNM
jgi:hypothetical protein